MLVWRREIDRRFNDGALVSVEWPKGFGKGTFLRYVGVVIALESFSLLGKIRKK